MDWRCGRQVRRAASFSTALLLVGCGITSPAPLMVEVALSASEVTEAEPVEVIVTATNRSDVAVDVDSHGCPPVFEVVRAARPGVVGPESVTCIAVALPPTRLEPGEDITFGYEWAGLGLESELLRAGEYRVRGWTRVARGDRVYSDYRSVRVTHD